MNTELLNQARKLITDGANANGVILSEQFESPEKFNEFVISYTIQQIQDITSMTTEEAYNIVMGEGAYQQLRADLWGHFENQRTA